MLVLRLDQAAEKGGGHRVEVTLSGPGLTPQRVSVRTGFAMAAADQERLRWYLEDFLEYPVDPAPTMATSIETRLGDLGRDLFAELFDSRDGARLWGRVQGQLPTMRVEVATEVEDATALPWELLRDPDNDVPLALQAASFVRVNHTVNQPVDVATDTDAGGTLRVLLVICRPAGRVDVPFRSVASRLVHLAGGSGRLAIHVLRPPTFARLTEVVDAAYRAGQPFHVVHFDGHGTYLDLDTRSVTVAGGSGGVSRHRYAGRNFASPPRPGRHGFLLFEDPDVDGNEQLVDGPALGAVLARSGVQVLVLNACRSAYAEAPTAPTDAGEAAAAEETPGGIASDDKDAAGVVDVHARVRAYGSLALEVADAGVPGVVAMRYSVYVVTAAKFVADLYAALLGGQSLGDAVTAGRRQLAAQPNRAIAFDPLPLQDWTVPVVYESAPLTLFPTSPDKPVLSLDDGEKAQGGGLTEVPRPPDVGFFGRDETLLALDRAFDRHRIVVLHAYAGQGKTATAAEFARWYHATGGLTDTDPRSGGVVVFSSREQYTPLPRLLNQLADTMTPLLEANNIAWQTLDETQRRRIALQILGVVPVLWIWDNVEPVAGFPHPTNSPWSVAEQEELADFLRDAARTKAKILLTSRRDEHGWLGNLPARVTLPPMPMRERIQLTQALAERHGHRIGEVADWRPLLRYTAGNPLTITVVVGQALRQGLTTKTQIEGFVQQLRAGESDLDDDDTQGRTKSLGASLGYGLATAFTDTERAQLGLLYLFQDTVDVDALVNMGAETNPNRLPGLAGLTRNTGIELLDRAADIGLLTALGGGYYTIHPALPWYFHHLHTTTTSSADDGGRDRDDLAEAAYTTAIAELGNYYARLFNEGRHEVIGLLRLEEANLLHARALARRAGRWGDVIGCMQGLRILYEHLGRGAEWARLVEELVPDLVDPTTGGPLPDRDEQWGLLTEYRIALARDARDWATAETLQHTRLAVEREPAAGALAADRSQLTDTDRHRIRTLAIGEQVLGDILREQHNPDCVAHFQRSADLFQRIGAHRDEAITVHSLGTAYLTMPQLRDLYQAEHWYRRSLDLFGEHDRIGHASTTAQLASVAYERFLDARQAGAPHQNLAEHLNTAATAYHQALDTLPTDAIIDRATVHHQLGNIYSYAGMHETALSHFEQSIKYKEDAGNRYGAGSTRYNIAVMFERAGRYGDALLYARAALRDFEPYGANAATNIEATRKLIVHLENAIEEGSA